MANPVGRPLKFISVDELEEQIEDYFKQHNFANDIPTITGLAVHLDVDRKTLYNYESKEEFFPTIKRALNKCEEAIERRAMLGGLNATIAIFSLKNNYGWVDKTETDVTTNGNDISAPVDANLLTQFLMSAQNNTKR